MLRGGVARTIERMTTLPATSRVPVGAALLAGVGAQFVDDVAYFVLPPTVLLAPLSGLLAVLLTAAAARLVSRNRTKNGKKLHVNDSKLVYATDAGLKELERGVHVESAGLTWPLPPEGPPESRPEPVGGSPRHWLRS